MEEDADIGTAPVKIFLKENNDRFLSCSSPG